MKQALAILLAYFTCTDPEKVTKWNNLLASFWHKDDGQVITAINDLPNGNIELVTVDGDGTEHRKEISQYTEPETFAIAKIAGLSVALADKVDKEIGKQLSTEDFTTVLKTKLDSLNNYVHPNSHPISMIEGLQALLDQTATDLTTINDQLTNGERFLNWNGYRWYKKQGNVNTYPAAGDELQGRGDGRYEGGEYIAHSEILRDLPEGQPIDQTADINIFKSYP